MTDVPVVTEVHSCVDGQFTPVPQTINWPNSFRSGVPPFGHPPTPQYAFEFMDYLERGNVNFGYKWKIHFNIQRIFWPYFLFN
jgi:hypothetical protein